MTSREHALDAPAHIHLRDAMHHIANARRSLNAAARTSPPGTDIRQLARLATFTARLGRAVARAGR